MNDQTNHEVNSDEAERTSVPIFIEGDYPLTELPLFVYDEQASILSEELRPLLEQNADSSDKKG